MMNYDRSKPDPITEINKLQTILDTMDKLIENDDLTWDMTVNITGRAQRVKIVYDLLTQKLEHYRKQLRLDILRGDIYISI